MKKIGLWLTAVLLVFALLLPSFVTVSAAASVPTTYSKEYNSGTRDVVCTTLSGTSAASYYSGYSYDTLSKMDDSQLFSALQTLMRNTHENTSSYNDCHYKADKTDCENGDGKVSLIYTSYSATMSQWNGWNREHVWPQSLGGGNTTGGGADLHHIRPSDAVVNSTRGNKKYGEAGNNATAVNGKNPATGYLGGYYNTYFEPLDNVKGDVARICLYVYVRWNSQWGADSITDVFQSVDVLLEWCELDPVDTWEMGRNEVVGAIQGNRNVFIDYPEYAWLIFDREVPTDMTTPSGEASTPSNPGTTNPDPSDPVTPPAGGDNTGDNNDPVDPPAGGDNTGDNNDPVTPPAGGVNTALVDATIDGSLPTTLAYITNNSEYPDPSFYSDGGLKLNFVNMGIQTTAFAAQNTVKATIKVKALNENTKTGDNAAVFTVYGLDAGGNVVATETIDEVVVGDNAVVLEGTDIVAVKVIMTNYAHNGNKFCNISVGGIKVEGETAGDNNDPADPPAGGDNNDPADPPAGGDNNDPGTSTPGSSTPGTSTPGTSNPGTSTPGTSNQGTTNQETATPSVDADCTHSFGAWEEIGSGMKARTCSQCGVSEVSTKTNQDEDEATKEGSNPVVYIIPAVVGFVVVVGAGLVVLRKKRK